MCVNKIQSAVNFLDISTKTNKNDVIANLSFKKMFMSEIEQHQTKTYTQEEIDNFVKSGAIYGEGQHLIFPPTDAPIEFKAIWNDVFKNMEGGELGLFNSEFTDILSNGVACPIEYPDLDTRYVAAQARISRLGYAGCVEFAIKTQERHISHQFGNEQKYIDQMNDRLNKLKEVRDRLQEIDDPTINHQIMIADGEYGILSAKDDRDGVELAAEMATGMSEEEFQVVLHRIAQRQIKIMADGSILTTVTRDGQIISSFRQKPHALDLLSLI